MKKLFSMLLLFCPLAVVAQSQQDYEQVMALFMKSYNARDTDKICQLFRAEFTQDGCSWIGDRLKGYGKMLAQRFVGIDSMSKSDNPVRVFKVTYSLAGVKAFSFSLHRNPTAATDLAQLPWFFGTFTFEDITPRIEQMVRRAK
jgi:hypothetical protein